MGNPGARDSHQSQPEDPDKKSGSDLRNSPPSGADETAAPDTLDELLPEIAGLDDRGIDIDIEDFEAFNRELDARMGEADSGKKGVDVIEDLGTEVVEYTSKESDDLEQDWGDTTAEPTLDAQTDRQQEVPDDLVTISTAAAAPQGSTADEPGHHVERIKEAIAQARRQRASGDEPLPTTAADSSEPLAPEHTAEPGRAGKGGGIAVLIGLAGLLAGGAALWLNMSRQAELERINATLAIRPDIVAQKPAAAPESGANVEAMRALATRMDLLKERISALEAKTAEEARAEEPAAALTIRLAELEAEMEALKKPLPPPTAKPDSPPPPALSPAASAPKGPAPGETDRKDAEPTIAKADASSAATQPAAAKPKAAEAVSPSAVATPPAAPKAAPEPTRAAPKPETATAAAEKPAAGSAEKPTPTTSQDKPAVAKAEAPKTKEPPPPVAEAEAPASAAQQQSPEKVATREPAQRATAAAPDSKEPPRQRVPMPEGGPWVVVLQSFSDEAAAEQRSAQAREFGIPAEVRWAQVKGQIWHRVIVPGYESQQSARAAAAEFGRRKLGSPWVLLLNRPE